MSSLAIADTDGALSLLDQAVKPVVDRLKQAREYRRKNYEPTWQMNLAYASGKHWLGWHDKTRTLRTIQELDPRYRGRELVTADVITEYRTTALGELGSDNDRPGLLLRRDDVASEDYQQQLSRALEYVWDHEIDADEVLSQIDQFMIDLGTAAVRCRFDPTVGAVVADNIPHYQGMPVLNEEDAMRLMENGPNPDVTMQPVRQGKICWEPLSAFGLLVPPGAAHEKSFAWEAVVTAAYLPDVKEMYGDVAAKLREDNDIANSLGVSVSSASLSAPSYQAGDAKDNRLRDHIWLYEYYERPSKKFPQGREITFSGNNFKLLDYKETLPYVGPDGTYRSGISYFHWWRVTGRFWSRGLVDVLKDAQRGINKRRTQINEIIDRNMPYVVVETGSQAKRRQGLVNELVEIGPNERAPMAVQGAQPGAWMQGDVEALREDLQHASGINGPRRGENPQNVTTYSQLALIAENDSAKRAPIYLARKRSIGRLVEDTVYDIRAYKGPNWEVALGSDDDMLEASVFNATQIPPFFIVSIGKGPAAPRSQATEIQKITDIWNGAVVSTAVQQSPTTWVRWYKESIEAGSALELPQDSVEDPGEKADYENHYMRQGVPMPIAYYDIHAVHLPRHRHAQDQAMFTHDEALWRTIENHCQLHINAAVAQAQAQAAQMQQQAAKPPAPTQGGTPSHSPNQPGGNS